MPSGDQMGLAKSGQASTTTGMFVAQEMMKPNPLVCTPKLGPLFRIRGFGSHPNAVGRPANVVPQPAVPGR